jgi:hypothetical protein
MDANRRYTVGLTAWLLVYGALLVATSLAFNRNAVPPVARIPVALLPMIAGFGLIAIVIQRLRAMDELEQRIQVEGLAFSVALTAMVTFSYGFLELHAGAPALSYFWVWPVLAAGWVIGLFIARTRYR